MPEPTRRALLRRTASHGTRGVTGADRRPVVLVHGFGDTGETPWWDELRGHLLADGYDEADLRTVSLGDRLFEAHDSPREYGVDIAAEIEAVHDERGCEVDVLAHSMGGLGSRWAIEQAGAAPQVRSLVTLGTPHQGTRAAHLARRTPGGRDMVPGSDFLGTLNDTGGGTDDVRYTAVWGSLDPLIVGRRRAEVPGAVLGEGDENLAAGRHTHLGLVSDRAVYRAYRGRLTGGRSPTG